MNDALTCVGCRALTALAVVLLCTSSWARFPQEQLSPMILATEVGAVAKALGSGGVACPEAGEQLIGDLTRLSQIARGVTSATGEQSFLDLAEFLDELGWELRQLLAADVDDGPEPDETDREARSHSVARCEAGVLFASRVLAGVADTLREDTWPSPHVPIGASRGLPSVLNDLGACTTPLPGGQVAVLIQGSAVITAWLPRPIEERATRGSLASGVHSPVVISVDDGRAAWGVAVPDPELPRVRLFVIRTLPTPKPPISVDLAVSSADWPHVVTASCKF